MPKTRAKYAVKKAPKTARKTSPAKRATNRKKTGRERLIGKRNQLRKPARIEPRHPQPRGADEWQLLEARSIINPGSNSNPIMFELVDIEVVSVPEDDFSLEDEE